MATAGVEVKKRTRETIRIAAAVLPMALVLYGLFIDLFPERDAQSGFIFSAIMIPWVTLGALMFLLPARSQGGVWLRFSLYHILAGAYILFISGFDTPFITLGWVLMLLISYIYLANPGLLLNGVVLLLVATADILLHASNRDRILLDVVSVGSIFIVGAFIIVLRRIQQADSDELLRSQAQEALQNTRIHTLINNLADAVININSEGRIEIYNAASLSLLNTNVSLHDKPIDDVIKPSDQSDSRINLFDLAKEAKGVMVRDDLSVTVDEENIRLEVTISPIRSSYSRSEGKSTVDGYVLILRDVTKAKSLEEERDEFISVVSHELRTPITIAEGTLSNMQLMVEKGKTPPGTLERSIASAHEQILFLSRMINDLSTLSRAERGVADESEAIDVKSLVNSLYSEYAPQAEKKHLQFNIDAAGRLGDVTTSHLYLRELLQNIITNAIKYTKEGSVTLQVSRSGDRVLFSVKDTGIGIGKSDQGKIFKKFYRSEDYRTRETGGTGLGLYVAQKLARKIGTSIEVKSRLNHGSTFSFSLPADSEPTKE